MLNSDNNTKAFRLKGEGIRPGDWKNKMKGITKSILEPSEFLMENVHLLPKGLALDLAMGNGRNAIFLAKMGFEVEGVDISSKAVNTALEAAHRSGINLIGCVVDLETEHYIEKNRYDLIICFHYLQRSLISNIKEGLHTGGMIVYETYTIDQVRFGKPKNPDHLLNHNELLEIFSDFRCLRYREGILEDRKAIAGIVAEKV